MAVRFFSWRKARLHPSGRLDLARLLDRTSFEAEAGVRALTHAVNLGDGEAVCRVLGRYKMFVDTADADLSVHLMLDGFWEMWVTRRMIETIKPGMVCVDVGANLGYFTILMGDLVGPRGKVFAFEPNAKLCSLMKRSAVINGFAETVEIHRNGVLDEDDLPIKLLIPGCYPGGGHIEQTDESDLRSRRLDSIPELLKADFIKIDAEGTENRVWAGMKGILDQNRPLIIFLEFIAARFEDPGAFLAELMGRGFALSVIDHVWGERPITPEKILSMHIHTNLELVLRR